jgi:hypothetical protein
MTYPPLAAPGSSDGAPLAVGNGRIIASRATPLQRFARRTARGDHADRAVVAGTRDAE